MPRNNLLNLNLKKLVELKNQLPKGASESLEKLHSQITSYEEKVKGLVQNIERDVQKIGKERLNQITSDLKKTRATVEKRVIGLVGETRKDLQVRINDLVTYVNNLAGREVIPAPKKAKKAKKTTRKTLPKKTKRVVAHSRTRNTHSSASAGLS